MTSTTTTSHEPVDYTQSEAMYGQVIHGAKGDEEGEGRVAANPSAVDVPLAEDEALRLGAKWRRREQYRIATVVLDVVVLITALATIAVAAVVFHDCNNFHRPNSDSPFLYVIVTFLLYIFVVIEGGLSFIAALTILICLLRKPESVLLRAPFDQGKFVCLCISLVLLLLFSGYTFAVPIFSDALELDPSEPVAFCIIPAVRLVAFLGIIGFLIANRAL